MLKDVLRPLRVSLGPVSTHLSLTAGLRQLTCPLSRPLHFVSASLLLAFAFLAGVLFRPDNNAVLELVRPLMELAGLRLNYRERVSCHALFNSLVLILAMINIVLQDQ